MMHRTSLQLSEVAPLLACACVASLGALWSYLFGVQIGGPPMGLLLAANAAIFGWLVAGTLANQALRLARRRHPQP